MQVKIVKVGFLETNCYLLINNNNCLIVDPGDEYLKIKENLKDLNVVGILLTHRHFDHIGALNNLVSDYKVSVYDKSNLEEKTHIISDFKFDVIYTIGHTKDSITIYFKDEKLMFTGDFLFKETVGRTDLEGGSHIEMQQSIELIKQYDKDIVIYPGHGDKSTLRHECNENIYFI